MADDKVVPWWPEPTPELTTEPWTVPPTKRSQASRHLRFHRTSYDLELSDPSSDDTITIKVGRSPNISTFHLSASAMKKTSDYFERALKPEWTHLSTRLIELPDVEPDLFDHYARWLASGAEVMTSEEDWRAEYAEYLRWQQDLDDDKERWVTDEKKTLCPGTV